MKRFVYLLTIFLVCSCDVNINKSREMSMSVRQSRQLGVFVDSCAIAIEKLDNGTALPTFEEAWLEKRWQYSPKDGMIFYPNDNYYTLIIKLKKYPSETKMYPLEIYTEHHPQGVAIYGNQFTFDLKKSYADSVNVFVVKAFTGESYAPDEQKTIGKLIVQRWGKTR